MAQLACEGACNGGRVQRFDEIARATRRMTQSPTGEARVMLAREDVAAMGRTLVHTEHDYVKTDGSKLIYACRVCGKERAWGANA